MNRTLIHLLRLMVIAWCISVRSMINGNDNMRVVYQWRQIDFDYHSDADREMALAQRTFIPKNVIPIGLEVYQKRLFVTLPRWKQGVPASLAYIDLNDNSTRSPKLKPYPSWGAHLIINDEPPEIISPFRIRADRCGRLWVLDTGIYEIFSNQTGATNHTTTTTTTNTQLLVYDLRNDNLLRRYTFPKSQVKAESLFANIAVEDGECDDTYVYCADLSAPGLVVYSWKLQESWRVQHNYFHPDPLAGNFSISGYNFQLDDGLFGLALSKQLPATGFATLYFHPLSSTMEFAISTQVLRNKTYATSVDNYADFKILGSRGPNGQSGAAFLDQLTGVLFYALPNLNAITCWKTSNRAYTIKSLGRVYMSPLEMVYPCDIKVDDQDRLWVLSNNLQQFIYGELDETKINFRILTAYVKDAITNTACDITPAPLPEIITKLGDILRPQKTPPAAAPSSASGYSLVSTPMLLTKYVILFVILMLNC